MSPRVARSGWARLGGVALVALGLGCPVDSGRMGLADPVPPNRPVISGPTTVTAGTQAFYNLSVTDPQGARVELLTSTPECAVAGFVLTFSPTKAGDVTIQVTARNSYGLSSEPGQVVVRVQAP